ncbi:MAG TPA: hypothetical protein VE242_07165 [Chthoniobacterales bacterium]|nr:hypothetical protein [Chthoniobacterales bacterium]
MALGLYLIVRFLSIGLYWVVAFSASAAPIEPRIVSTATAKIGALTGPQGFTDQKKVDVCGTDLGIMSELNGRICIRGHLWLRW